jgi:uncharacterized protein YcaQ
MRISRPQARRLAIACQGLDERWRLPKGKEGAAQAVERLGYVQLDTIAVVERAHHHTLWSRCPDYAPAMLHELQAADRRVFEYWAKAACYLPMRDYRFYLPRMRAVAASKGGWYYTREARKITKHVLDRIRAEGPLGSAGFKAPEGKKRGSWWDWTPAKRALEWLFDAGELMVTERRHFHRIYDLTERVLPSGVDTTPATPDEVARFIVRRVLARTGFARAEAIRWGWRRPSTVDAAIEELVASGEITQVSVAGLAGDHYALASTLERAGRRSRRKRLHILSPFDGLVMDRRRVQALFGFECKLECYLPAAKRRWGYFCLPLLWGDEFVGRLDPKADRKAKALIVRKLIFEPGFTDCDAVLPPLADKLRAFAALNGCDRVVVEQAAPRKAIAPLKRELGT